VTDGKEIASISANRDPEVSSNPYIIIWDMINNGKVILSQDEWGSS